MSQRWRSFLVVLVALVCVASIRADWPQFRGPGGMGVSTARGLPTTWSTQSNLAWKIELPGPGTSSPSIFGDRIYLTCYTGFNPATRTGSMDQLKIHLLCLNLADGKTIWTRDITPRLPEQASIREGHGYASSTPAVNRDGIYLFLGKTGALAFSHEGKQLWQTNLGEKVNGWGSAASPILFGNSVIVNASVESETIYALDKKTGQELWKVGGIREAWNTPVLVPVPGGKTELVVGVIGRLHGMDPSNGSKLWQCNTEITWYMVPGLVAHEGIVYCVGGRSGGALAVKAGGTGDVTRTHRLWTGRKGSNVTSPIYHDGHMYWMHEDRGIAYCAEAKTGKIVYEERVPGASQVYASPILAAGKLYHIDRLGKCFVIAARPEYQLLATNDLRDRSTFNASPAVAGERLYVRSDRHLYCIGAK